MDHKRKEAIEQGLRFYRPAKPCKHGHWIRSVATYNCLICLREKAKKYREDPAYREKQAAYHKAWRENPANKEKIRKIWRRYEAKKRAERTKDEE